METQERRLRVHHNLHRIAALAGRARRIEIDGGRVPERIRAVLSIFQGISEQMLFDKMQEWMNVQDKVEAPVQREEDAIISERRWNDHYKNSWLVESNTW